jgi:hypothetical protein
VYNTLVEDFPVTIGKALSKRERQTKDLRAGTLVYGEIEFASYARAINMIKTSFDGMQTPGGVFVDFGSGTGKAVLAAALLHRFDRCVGIEILENLHKAALELKDKWHTLGRDAGIPAAHRDVLIDFHLGDAMEEYSEDNEAGQKYDPSQVRGEGKGWGGGGGRGGGRDREMNRTTPLREKERERDESCDPREIERHTHEGHMCSS